MIRLIICVLVIILSVVVYQMAIKIQELEEDIEGQEFLMSRIWLCLNNNDNDGARDLLASYFRNKRN